MKSRKLALFTGLLLGNIGLPLQADDSWSQQIIGGLLRTPAPIRVGCAVAGASAGYGSFLRYTTTNLIGPREMEISSQGSKNGAKQSFTYSVSPIDHYGMSRSILLHSALIGSVAAAIAYKGNLSVLDIAKPVGTGMAVVAGGYLFGACKGYYDFYKLPNVEGGSTVFFENLEGCKNRWKNELPRLTTMIDDVCSKKLDQTYPEFKFKDESLYRYVIAESAYNVASIIIPVAVCGVGVYMVRHPSCS